MAPEKRGSDNSLIDRLLDKPQSFDFFQAVRLLAKSANVNINLRSPLNFIRFHVYQSLAFPSSAIHSVLNSSQPKLFEMWVTFMGLTGTTGALPTHYSELLTKPDLKSKHNVTMAFFDIFNHRLISLFYISWQKSRIWLDRDREPDKKVQRYFLSLIGLMPGQQSKHQDCNLDTDMLTYYAGLISQKPRSTSALTAILRDYFQTEVSVTQFYGRWLQLSELQRTQIGKQNYLLGETTFLGSKIWDCQSAFLISLGPLTLSQYHDYLPDGKTHQILLDFVRLYIGLDIDVYLRLIIKKEEVQRYQFNSLNSRTTSQLGMSIWLKNRRLLIADPVVVFKTYFSRKN